MSKIKVIAVDNGWQQTKSKNYSFKSGLARGETSSGIGDGDILVFEGKHYIIASESMPHKPDKTIDDDHFILTLFAIAKELTHDNMDFLADLNKNGATEIELVVGLPPKDYQRQKEGFAKYFQREKVSFKFNSLDIHIEITHVFVFPQAYAAAIALREKFKGSNLTNVVDIGGHTADCLRVLKDFKFDGDTVDSLDDKVGVNALYALIKKKARANGGKKILEDTITEILLNDPITIKNSSKERIDLVQDTAKEFTKRLLGKIANPDEVGFDLTEDTTLFVGGGALLLKEFIENSELVAKPVFADSDKDNVTGYEMLHKVRTRPKTSVSA